MNNTLNKRIISSDNQVSLLDVYFPENFEKQENPQLILFLHGYKGYKDWGAWNLLEKAFIDKGIGFAKMNFSHNGGTPENPIDFPNLDLFSKNTYSKELYDVNCVIDYIFEQYSDISFELILMGHSRGGGIAILQTARDSRVSKLITLAAIDDIGSRFPKGEALDNWKKDGVRYVKNGRTQQDMPHLYEMYEDWLNNKERLDIQSQANKITQPTLIIHGDKDEAVAIEAAYNLNKSIKKSRLCIIDGANHTFGSVQPYCSAKMPKDLNHFFEISLKWIFNT